ncbi:extracellular solute-binding protein [Acidiphilium sp. PA]|uniref:ABC transporter substrate-binding protein n=1 Tax=Acidiphilium sp. PA TaxID=2871705 RepID=UPI0022442715|nr:extracellular solute-binding protein [Acidiphilium sp. PA]MCW8306531.1 extracellular solute-binding protein [Acidiphilium sp. PA]
MFLPYRAVAAGLTLYSRLDFAQAVGVAFSRQTGIAVRVRRPPPHGLFARIRAEGDHPRWSVAWFYGASAAVTLDRHGLLAHGLDAQSGPTAMGAASVPADGSYVATGLGLGGVLVMPKAAPFAPPATWAALTTPAYRGLIGMNDPATSDQGVPPVMAMVHAAGGWPAAQGYFLRLKRSGLHIYGDTGTTLAALRSGAIQIAIMRSSAAFWARTIDPSLRVVVPQPAAVVASVIVMARHLPASQRAAAERFIAYVNSPAALRIEMHQGRADGAFWPVMNDVAPASLMPSATSLPLVMVDPAQSARDRSAIIAWFSKTIVGAST